MYDVNYAGSTMEFYKFDSAEAVSAKRRFVRLLKLAAVGLNQNKRLPQEAQDLQSDLWFMANDPAMRIYVSSFNEKLDTYRSYVNDMLYR